MEVQKPISRIRNWLFLLGPNQACLNLGLKEKAVISYLDFHSLVYSSVNIPFTRKTPSNDRLSKYVEYYLIAKDAGGIMQNLPNIYAYPGIKPELILVLDGVFSFHYHGKDHEVKTSLLFSHIDERVSLDLSRISSLVAIYFKPAAVGSLIPFTNLTAEHLIKRHTWQGDEVFGSRINQLIAWMNVLSIDQIADELDEWLLSCFRSSSSGFLTDMLHDAGDSCSLEHILQRTNYSYSTLKRHFQQIAGLSPKKYQTIRRCKRAIEEIYTSRNQDWMHYVNQYGYFDQSHFIKDIRKNTGFTPGELLKVPALLDFRSPVF